MAREAYGSFRHPATAPLTQLGPSLFVLELFHGPTLAFKDLAMQLVARLMDHVLLAARRAHHHRCRDLGRHRRRRGRGLPRPRPGGRGRAVSAWPHLRGAAAHDDHGAGRQRARARHRRHLRRLPGAGEGDVQPPRLPRPRAACPASIRSTGRASWRRRSITSPPRSRSARRIAKSPSPCRPEISATSMPAMSPPAWGCRSTGWWWRPMSTTSSPAPSPPAPMSCATWWRPPRRRWTSRSRRISSGCCSTPMAATPERCAR